MNHLDALYAAQVMEAIGAKGKSLEGNPPHDLHHGVRACASQNMKRLFVA
jgi:hypothetical protein